MHRLTGLFGRYQLGVPSAAFASDYTSPTTVVVTTPSPAPQVLGETIQTPATVRTNPAPLHNSLPFTGGDVAGLVVGGVVLLGAGTILVRRNRVNGAER